MHCRQSSVATTTGALLARGRLRGFTLVEILVVIVIISVIVAATTISVGVLGRDRQAEDQARRLWAVMQQAREESELQGLDAGLYVVNDAYEFLRFQPRANAWQPIPEDPLYVPRTMPTGLSFRARLDGREIVLKPQLITRTVAPIRKLSESPVRKLGDDDEEEEAEDDDAGDNGKTKGKTQKRRLGDGGSSYNSPGLGQEKDGRKEEDDDNPLPQIVLLASGEVSPFEIEIQRDGAPALWRVIGTADNDLRVERRDDASRWEIIAQTKPPEEEPTRRTRR